jgi:hypothetical protein
MVERIEEISGGQLISVDLDHDLNGPCSILLDREELDAIVEFAKVIYAREAKVSKIKIASLSLNPNGA